MAKAEGADAVGLRRHANFTPASEARDIRLGNGVDRPRCQTP